MPNVWVPLQLVERLRGIAAFAGEREYVEELDDVLLHHSEGAARYLDSAVRLHLHLPTCSIHKTPVFKGDRIDVPPCDCGLFEIREERNV